MSETIHEVEDADSKRQPCEVYSRIVGYIRPVDQWNPGKQAEFHDRVTFDGVMKNDG